ncbi:MAG TPA: carboxylating nicotinate-nucleotide diphosphorylase [Xenococcaceae cyanobacterium]
MVVLPAQLLIEPLLKTWLLEDIGRGDLTTQGLLLDSEGKAEWIVKENGVIAGLPIAAKVFRLLDEQIKFVAMVEEGEFCESGKAIAKIGGKKEALLTGERVALNLAMLLSGIATTTKKYVEKIADLPTQLVDTRKTTPGLRVLEKYATQVGGGVNHRLGLDDAVMIKDNHIRAAGGISQAIALIKNTIPYTSSIEVETSNLEEVKEALANQVDIIMLDNMSLEMMNQAVAVIRQHDQKVKIEASGNITLERIRAVAETGVDYISSSAPITRSCWLDLSMKMVE